MASGKSLLRSSGVLLALLSLTALTVGSLVTVGRASSKSPSSSPSFVTFESSQVRPLAMSPDGTRLFAVNTPDGSLEIFQIGPSGLTHTGSVPVGMEPVAVAARTNGEVWVVNHLSDSVSIVDMSSTPPRVARTILVGDEPSDVVFGGTSRTRAFITTAHRGQNNPFDPQLLTPSVGRADVWVFDAQNLGSGLGGTPLSIMSLFGDTPRALTVSPDGSVVYAAVFLSGNQTTAIHEGAVPGGMMTPSTNADGVTAPETGVIAKFDGAHWLDDLGRNWDAQVKFSLPDYDVFAINANATPPTLSSTFSGVGTVLFGMVTNPQSGNVYVSNTEARNNFRFEGPGVFWGSTVRGHLHESRITVLSGGSVLPRHLNKHIDYNAFPGTQEENDKSLAFPQGMAVTADGSTLYVAAFGSRKIGVFDTASLEDDTFVPDQANQIELSAGGPTGVVLDEAHGVLYAMTRFDDGISVVDLATKTETAHHTLHNPEPPEVVAGRPLLYDARYTSSHGDSACASCHVSADLDGLAWDLGNPDGSVTNNPNPFRFGPAGDPSFHPMKGPMTTQSLRGMSHGGPMHWRGDRTAGNDPGGDPLDSHGALVKFNVAFEGLVGRTGPLTDEEMNALADFLLEITYPPNPIRALDNSLTASQSRGHDFFFTELSDNQLTCNGCHHTDPVNGYFGTDGFSSFEGETQHFKIPQLRNAYTKVGMFGMPVVPQIRVGDNGPKGPQIRGFGFVHDGSVDTLVRFHRSFVFSFTGGDPERTDVANWVLAFDSDLAPIVGQQITLTATNGATVGSRINLLIARAAVTSPRPECDLVVKGNIAGIARGWVRKDDGMFYPDRASEAPLTDAQLRALAGTAGQELTYTCVPPGSGTRVGIDRDEDGYLDRDELDAGSDPTNPASVPQDIDGDGVINSLDCAPNDPTTYPGAPQLCDGIDNTCSGVVPPDELDLDGDGYVACTGWNDVTGTHPSILGGGDCDDTRPTIHPGAVETCNGIDDNCNGQVDEGVAVPAATPYMLVGKQGTTVYMAWNPVANATGYDVVRGLLSTLHSSGGNFTTSTIACVQDDTSQSQFTICDTPPAGDGSWYLARPNNCGGKGTYDSLAASQVAPRGSQIAPSSAACP